MATRTKRTKRPKTETPTLAEGSHELADGGKLVLIKDFMTPKHAQELFDELRETAPWEQKKVAWGRMRPRLTASYGDEGVTYRYSNTKEIANPWTATLLKIKRQIENAIARFEQPTIFNFLLLNRYRDGNDSVELHADDKPGVGNVIGSVSLGVTRTFSIRHNSSGERFDIPASHGSLIIMGGTMQEFWEHGVDKDTEIEGERINLTFRRNA